MNVEIEVIKDNNLTEIYINGFYLCSVHLNDLSNEMKEILEVQDNENTKYN